MNTKRKHHYPAVAYDLSDGTRTQAESLTKLAAKLQVDSANLIAAAAGNHVVYHRWFVCRLEQEQDLRADVDKWIRWYDKQRGKLKATTHAADKDKPKFVQLRIDSRTVIYVKPENATEEYAEKYRQKLANAGKRR